MEKGGTINHDLNKAPKTGDWKFMKPEVDREKCIGCATCVGFCPEAAIILEELEKVEQGQKPKAEIDMEWCKGCGVCAQVCPVKAIIMKKL